MRKLLERKNSSKPCSKPLKFATVIIDAASMMPRSLQENFLQPNLFRMNRNSLNVHSEPPIQSFKPLSMLHCPQMPL